MAPRLIAGMLFDSWTAGGLGKKSCFDPVRGMESQFKLFYERRSCPAGNRRLSYSGIARLIAPPEARKKCFSFIQPRLELLWLARFWPSDNVCSTDNHSLSRQNCREVQEENKRVGRPASGLGVGKRNANREIKPDAVRTANAGSASLIREFLDLRFI